ncbi:hypothetical protein ACFTXB_19375 [Streptomyces sp. NPDC057074]|uniref:hypothetical protein n=1 Tax=Streptomyces sp. NPDC057074 TaxID=3346015 RepID=UPI0036424889
MLSAALPAVMELPPTHAPDPAGGRAVLNLAMGAPAHGPERFAPVADRLSGAPAAASAAAITTPTPRPEAHPC